MRIDHVCFSRSSCKKSRRAALASKSTPACTDDELHRVGASSAAVALLQMASQFVEANCSVFRRRRAVCYPLSCHAACRCHAISRANSELDAPTRVLQTARPCKRAYAKRTLRFGRRRLSWKAWRTRHATDEASFEAKASEGSRTGVGSRRRVFVAGGRRIRSDRVPAADIPSPNTARVPKSRSVKKKSPTSAWGRSTSSTRKTPAPLGKASKRPEVAAAAEAAEAAAAAEAAPEAAEAAAAAAAAVAAAACRGEFAASARLEHVPITRTDAGLSWPGLTRFDPANHVSSAVQPARMRCPERVRARPSPSKTGVNALTLRMTPSG